MVRDSSGISSRQTGVGAAVEALVVAEDPVRVYLERVAEG